MRGRNPLIDPANMSQQLRTPERKKNKKSVKRDTSAQIPLFELETSEIN